MSYKKAIIEFLSEPENMTFLLDIEPLIPEVRNHKYEKCFEKFLKDYLLPLPEIWINYSYEITNNTFFLINGDFKGENYFRLHVHVGDRDKNNWYGIYGSEETLGRPIPEFEKLRELLKSEGVIKRDKYVLAYEYFPRNRKELLTIPNEAIDDFLMEWSEIFWNFAGNIKSAVEASNEILSKNMD